jgi:hypothetical protein
MAGKRATHAGSRAKREVFPLETDSGFEDECRGEGDLEIGNENVSIEQVSTCMFSANRKWQRMYKFVVPVADLAFISVILSIFGNILYFILL